MNRLRIGCDLDDVVTETVLAVENFHRKQFPMEPVRTPTDWYDILNMPRLEGDPARFKSMINYFTEIGGFRDLLPVNGSIQVIDDWRKEGHSIYFISARNSRAIPDTYRWLHEHGQPLDHVYFDRDKKWHAERLGLDVMIDDGVHNLDILDIPDTIIYNRPWNQAPNSTRVHWRAKNWAEVRQAVNHVYERKARNIPWSEILPEVYRDEK